MLANQPCIPLRDEGEWRHELTDLRREVAQMRSVIKDAASVEALMQERSGRELGENSIRHLSAQIEETLLVRLQLCVQTTRTSVHPSLNP